MPQFAFRRIPIKHILEFYERITDTKVICECNHILSSMADATIANMLGVCLVSYCKGVSKQRAMAKSSLSLVLMWRAPLEIGVKDMPINAIMANDCQGQTQLAPRAVAKRLAPAGHRDCLRPEVVIPQGACIRRAVCQEDLLAAYKFVCKMKVNLGYPAPGPEVIWSDPTDDPRDIATFVAKAWPGIVATTTFILDCQYLPLPADRVFPELQELRSDGRFISELTNRSAVPQYYRSNVPNDLLRCSVAHGQFVGCSDLLTVVRPWEQTKYEALGFRRIGPVRSSGSAVPEPVALMRLDLLALQQGGAGTGVSTQPMEDLRLLWRFYFAANPYVSHIQGWASLVDAELRSGRIGPVAESEVSDEDCVTDEEFKEAV